MQRQRWILTEVLAENVHEEKLTSVSAGTNRGIIFYTGVSPRRMQICIFIVATSVLMTMFADEQEQGIFSFLANHCAPPYASL